MQIGGHGYAASSHACQFSISIQVHVFKLPPSMIELPLLYPQAIYDRCFSLLPHPSLVRMRVRLRDPLDMGSAQGSGGEDDVLESLGRANPSCLFALECILPEVNIEWCCRVFGVG
jgi:hypothetical protein